MLQIDDKIVSLDLIDEKFSCNLQVCKGICCVEGDAGAPLEIDELKEIEKNFDNIKKYLPERSLKTIEKYGLYEKDDDGDYVTVCVDNKDCVFLLKENGIYLCAFEKAYDNGESSFQKPVSCHLYPVRVTEYSNFIAVNYEQRDICKAGRLLGKQKNITLYEFLKEPLIRKFGKEWFDKLDIAAKHLNKQQ